VLRDVLDRASDVVDNRASPRHISWQMDFLRECAVRHGVPVHGATHLDVGCGAATPFSRMFGHLLAGAKEGICLELEPIRDLGEAVLHLARIAATVAIDPSIVFPNRTITNRECLANVGDFDLAKLANRDASGLNAGRLQFLQRSADDTGLANQSIDLVVSNSLLEHVPDPEGAVRELARITKPGGFAIHGIDVADHRWYADPSISRLEFLTLESASPIVHHCNRLRLCDFESIFEKHGFHTVERRPDACHAVPPELRMRLQPTWKALSDLELGTTWCVYVFRKV
jgi:SAM-dependent methyltransferase